MFLAKANRRIKKPFFIGILFLLAASKIFSQNAGSQKLITIPVPQAYGGVVQGYIYVPSDYNTSTRRYPVIFFNNGTLAPATVSGVLTQSLPSMLASGMSLENIVNPQDGLKYSFIVVSLLNNPYFGIPAELRWLNANYRIDNARVYVTGLSQGGLSTMMAEASVDSVSKLIAAAVPMSTPNVPTSVFNFSLLNTYKIKTWFFAGNSDAFTAAGTQLYYTTIAHSYPGLAVETIYNGGHGGWNTFYSVNYKDPNLNMSIYQWMLTQSNATKFPVLPVKIKSIKLNRKQ